MIVILLAASTLVVNEILFDPVGPDSGREFVEILNVSETSEPLAGLVLEAGDGARPGTWQPVWAGSAGELVAGELLLVGGDSLGTAHRLTADLQNGPDALRLRRGDTVLDRVGYGALTDARLFESRPAPDVGGSSLARVPDGRDTDDNAADFTAASPTPGRLNVLRHNWALSLRPPDPTAVLPARTVRFGVVASNRGIDTLVADWPIRARLRGPCASATAAAADAAPEWPLEVVVQRRRTAPGDSCLGEVRWMAAHGLFHVEIALQGADQDTTDDAGAEWLRVGAGAVIVNEILFAPESGRCEWVEIWNRSEEALSLQSWTLADASGKRGQVQGSPVVDSGAFAIVSQDTADAIDSAPPGVQRIAVSPWNALNNSDGPEGYADLLVLRDGEGVVEDALRYSAASAGEKGRSLERLAADPDVNGLLWSPCKAPARATPGSANSSHAPAGRGRSVELAPNPFSPDGDGRDDLLFVALEVPSDCAGVRARIYDLQGRCRSTLADDRLGPGPRQLAWDGRGSDGAHLIAGIYILHLEFYPRSGPAGSLRRVVGVRRP